MKHTWVVILIVAAALIYAGFQADLKVRLKSGNLIWLSLEVAGLRD